jgi:hypothetical protein
LISKKLKGQLLLSDLLEELHFIIEFRTIILLK